MNVSKKIRFFSRLLVAIIKTRYKIVAVGLLLGIFFYFFAPEFYKLIPQKTKTLKIGLVGQFSVDNIPLRILQETSFGLTDFSAKDEVIPALAENWTILDEGKTYVFTLKKNDLTWHDGKTFSPQDINYNFKDIEFSLKESSIIFKLKEPFSPLPSVLSRPIFRKGLIGLGKYQVKRITKSGRFVSSIFLVPYKESLPGKLFRFYNRENDLKMGFNLGEVDILENIFDEGGLQLGSLTKKEEQITKNAYVGIFFNTTDPPFSSKSFRQALAYAIPKETGEKRALGPISPYSWAYNPDVKHYDLERQHSLDLISKENVDTSSLNIKIFAFPLFEQTANEVKDSWLKIGIKSEVQIIDEIPEQFQVLIIGREIPRDPDQYYFWHSTQAGNISNFKSPRIDKLLEDGRKILTKEERQSIYFDFQRYLVEESPVIFLFHPVTYRVVRD